MSKANFLKAEEALAAALQKMTVDQLLELANTVQSPTTPALNSPRMQLATVVRQALKCLYLADRAIYKKLNISKKKLEKLTERPTELTEEEWEQLVQIKAKIDEYLKTQTANLSDEKLIEEQRKKHINKRFNVNEKWLPLK